MSDTNDLADQRCAPAPKGTRPLNRLEFGPLLEKLTGWQVIEDHHLSRDFRFDDFMSALRFVNAIALIAEEENHHPEVTVGWGHARVDIWTHNIGGLSMSDFVLAAKISRL